MNEPLAHTICGLLGEKCQPRAQGVDLGLGQNLAEHPAVELVGGWRPVDDRKSSGCHSDASQQDELADQRPGQAEAGRTLWQVWLAGP
jgi:hypothetical protein